MEDDVRGEYKSSLADLNCNSKPHINCLTMIAGDNADHASQIVDVIVDHVKTVSPELKLPCLYLVDSIVKNIGKDYLSLFSEKIVTIFTTVFEKVDEKTRILLYRLRQTWSEIFPNKILFGIDVSVKQIDPAWPVTAQPPAQQSIHINPKFLGSTQKKTGTSSILAKKEEEALKHLLAKEQLRHLDEKKAEMVKKHGSSTSNPVVLHLQPSQSPSVVGQAALFPSVSLQHHNNQSLDRRPLLTQVDQRKTKLDPRISQRDPRLAKNVGSVTNKMQHEVKSHENHSCGTKYLSDPSPKQSAISSVVLVPGATTSKASEVTSHSVTLSRTGSKSEKIQDVSKDKAHSKIHPPEKENVPNHQMSSEAIKLPKRNSSPKKLENETGAKRSPEKLEKTLLQKNRQSASPNKEKNAEKQKQKNNDKKSPVKAKNCENKKSEVKSLVINDPVSEKSKKEILENKSMIVKEGTSAPSVQRITRNQAKIEKAFEGKRITSRHRSRSPLHSVPKKKEAGKARKTFQNHTKNKIEDHTGRNSKSVENAALAQPTSNLLAVDTDLRIPTEHAEKVNSSTKRDQNSFEINEGLDNELEPPEKKAKSEIEEPSSSVSLFGTEDQDYRHKDRTDDNQHLGWAQYKVFHPDEFKTPLRPARENMENNVPDGFRGNNENLHPKHLVPARYFPYAQNIDQDRFGRPRLNRRYRDQRHQNHFVKRHQRFGNHISDMRNQITNMFSDPKMILRETEKRFQDGLISQDQYSEISRSLHQVWNSGKAVETWAPNSHTYYLPDHRFPDHSNDVFHADQTRPPNIPFPVSDDPAFHTLRVQGPLASAPPESSNSVEIDQKMRIIHFVDDKAIVLMDNNDPRQLTFKGPPTQVYIEGMKPITLTFDGKPVEFDLEGKTYSIRFGTPSREIYINNYPYNAKFGGTFRALLGSKVYTIAIGFPRPQVVVGEELQHQLYEKFLAQNPEIMRNPHAVEKSQPQDIDLRSDQDESLTGGPASVDSGDVDMRTEEGHTDSNDLGYEASSGMKDVDWRQASSSVNYNQLPRPENELIANKYSPDYVGENVPLHPHNPQFESSPHMSPQRRQIANPELDHSIAGNSCMEVVPEAAHSNWREQGLGSSENWHKERPYNEWETNKHKSQDWSNPSQRFCHPADQAQNRPPPRTPYWQGENKILKPPYPPIETGENLHLNQQHDVLVPPNQWQVPPPPLPGQVRPNFENWEWKHKGFIENVNRPPVPMSQPGQNYSHNTQRTEENYGVTYEGIMRPPTHRHVGGHQIRPMLPSRLRPSMPRGNFFQQGPPAPGQRPWHPRIPQDAVSLNRLRLTLPPPPLPPASMRAHINPPSRLPLLPPTNTGIATPVVNPLGSTPVVQMPTTQITNLSAPTLTTSDTGMDCAPPVETDPSGISGATSEHFGTMNMGIDVTALFDKLVAAGIINTAVEEKSVLDVKKDDEPADDESETSKDEDKGPQEEAVPPINFSSENLKCRYPAVVSALVRGSQCASCGMRFKDTRSEHYSRHLDWHFRVNRREKDGAKKAFSRKWYYEVEDWIQFEEFEDFEERARSFFELQADEEQFQIPPNVEVPSVPACGQETEVCVVCAETFESFWGEEQEEWHLRDAVRHDGQPYHPLCYEDFVKASKIPDTPTDVMPDTTDGSKIDVKDEDMVEPENEKSTEDIDVEIKIEPSIDDVQEPSTVETEMAVIKEEKIEEDVEKMEEDLEKTESTTPVPAVDPGMDSLEGKPGEEEIIGVIAESDIQIEIEEPRKESKMVVMQSGGIVMKVRAESIQPASPATAVTSEKDSASKVPEAESEDDDFRPPTPDPRFQVLPPVMKGNELSGLCSIM